MVISKSLAAVKQSLVVDRFLWLAILLAFGLSLIGANWGRMEDWNPDQMAFRSVPNNLMVSDYLKPPLDTYINRLLVLNPVDILMNGILHTERKARQEMRLLAVHIFTILHFCAALAFVYICIDRCCGKKAASVIALLMGTSAGLLAYNHYGSSDTPLLFWMMASFAFALIAATSDKLHFGLIAGVLAGLAAACKYNGLGVAVALPVAFLVMQGVRAFWNKNLWLSGLAVPVGFVLGVPGAIFDQKHFLQDFLYNLYTTPVYAGDVSHVGYLKFLRRFPELLGIPCSYLLAGCIASSLLLLVFRRLEKREVLLFLSAMAVFVFYFITIGRFPRIETRFVLPAIPFLLVAAAPAVARVNRHLLVGVVAILVIYNATCSVLVGLRYLNDPRMVACDWVEKNFRPGMRVETVYSPTWDFLVPGVKLISMPISTGRTQRFKNLFGNNAVVSAGIEKFDSDPGLEIFTKEGVQKRDPDYVTFCSFAVYYSSPKEVRKYYEDHVNNQLGYQTVFLSSTKPVPGWSYPQRLDFIPDKMFILKRTP